MTKKKTLFDAYIANRVTEHKAKNVMILDSKRLPLNLEKNVCEIVDEHTNIWESAVEIQAENIPAKISPTKKEGRVSNANNGNANSVSSVINSGNNTRAERPTRTAAIENTTYQPK